MFFGRRSLVVPMAASLRSAAIYAPRSGPMIFYFRKKFPIHKKHKCFLAGVPWRFPMAAERSDAAIYAHPFRDDDFLLS